MEGLSKGLNKLTLLLLPFILSVSDYGKIGLLVSIEVILPLISLLGLDRAILRFYAKRKNYNKFSSTVYYSVFWLHLAVMFLLLIAWVLGFKEVFGLKVFPDIFLIILLVYFQGVNLLQFNSFRVDCKDRLYFRWKLIFQVLKFILVFSLVLAFDNYLGYVYGSLIAAFSVNIFFNKTTFKVNKRGFDSKTFKRLFSFSWPFLFHGVASNLLGNADKFLIEKFLNFEEVGYYTLAYSYGSVMIFAFVGVSIYMEPLIYKESTVEKRDNLLNKFLIFTLITGLLGFIALIVISKSVLPIFYEDNYLVTFKYIPHLALAYLIFPFYLKATYKLTYSNKTFNIAVISIISSLLNIGLNFYWIPKFGIYGAVLATLISYCVQGIIFSFVAGQFRITKDLFFSIILSVMTSVFLVYDISLILVIALLTLFTISVYFLILKKRTFYGV